ncbi:hypothetical protein AB0I22_33605 [Streptomyces sp. NPDC050610]|uniref:hypothetical protein n=1 Tax=Streptomyces sp. NPDC050610 TaxID=3157097 RepID=UPI003448F7D8
MPWKAVSTARFSPSRNFTVQIITEDHEDVAGILTQLTAVGVGQALHAHPAPNGARPVRLTVVWEAPKMAQWGAHQVRATAPLCLRAVECL